MSDMCDSLNSFIIIIIIIINHRFRSNDIINKKCTLNVVVGRYVYKMFKLHT